MQFLTSALSAVTITTGSDGETIQYLWQTYNDWVQGDGFHYYIDPGDGYLTLNSRRHFVWTYSGYWSTKSFDGQYSNPSFDYERGIWYSDTFIIYGDQIRFPFRGRVTGTNDVVLDVDVNGTYERYCLRSWTTSHHPWLTNIWNVSQYKGRTARIIGWKQDVGPWRWIGFSNNFNIEPFYQANSSGNKLNLRYNYGEFHSEIFGVDTGLMKLTRVDCEWNDIPGINVSIEARSGTSVFNVKQTFMDWNVSGSWGWSSFNIHYTQPIEDYHTGYMWTDTFIIYGDEIRFPYRGIVNGYNDVVLDVGNDGIYERYCPRNYTNNPNYNPYFNNIWNVSEFKGKPAVIKAWKWEVGPWRWIGFCSHNRYMADPYYNNPFTQTDQMGNKIDFSLYDWSDWIPLSNGCTPDTTLIGNYFQYRLRIESDSDLLIPRIYSVRVQLNSITEPEAVINTIPLSSITKTMDVQIMVQANTMVETSSLKFQSATGKTIELQLTNPSGDKINFEATLSVTKELDGGVGRFIWEAYSIDGTYGNKIISGETMLIDLLPEAIINLPQDTPFCKGEHCITLITDKAIANSRLWLITEDGDSFEIVLHKTEDELVWEGVLKIDEYTGDGVGRFYWEGVTNFGNISHQVVQGETVVIDASGIVFLPAKRFITINRDYAQEVILTLKNLDNEPHEFKLLPVFGLPGDILVGFIGDGIDTTGYLDSGQSQDVTLIIHSQDSQRDVYTIPVEILSMKTNQVMCYRGELNVMVRRPNINFDIILISEEPVSGIRKYKIMNHGDTMTDVRLRIGDDLAGEIIFSPQMNHGLIGQGEEFEFYVVPQYLNSGITEISGSWFVEALVTLDGMNARISREIKEQWILDKPLWLVELDDPWVYAHVRDWYCINRRNITMGFNIPPGFDSTDVDQRRLITQIRIALPGGHRVRYYLNGNYIPALDKIISANELPGTILQYNVPGPQIDLGWYNWTGSRWNVLQIITSPEANPGHYVSSTRTRFGWRIPPPPYGPPPEWPEFPAPGPCPAGEGHTFKIIMPGDTYEQALQAAWKLPYVYSIADTLQVVILNPKPNFEIRKCSNILISARVTDNTGIPQGEYHTDIVLAVFNTGEDSLVLYDDGLHSDGYENDGLYANYWDAKTIGPVGFTVWAYNSKDLTGDTVYGSILPNVPPEVRLIYPNGNERLSGVILVSWVAVDADNDDLTYSLYYGHSKTGRFYLLAAGISTTQYLLDTTQIPDGTYYFKVIASDGRFVGMDISDGLNWIRNIPVYAPELDMLPSYVNSSHLTIKGSAEEGMNVVTIIEKEDGEQIICDTVIADRSGRFTTIAVLPLEDEKYSVYAYAVDNKGNISQYSKKQEVMYLIEPPAPLSIDLVPISSPTRGPVVLSYQIMRGEILIPNAVITGDHSPYYATGYYDEILTVTDPVYGDQTTVRVNFVIDTQPPLIDLIYPIGGETFYPGDNIFIQFSVEDNYPSGLTYLAYLIGKDVIIEVQPGMIIKATDIPAKDYILQIHAKDKVGNISLVTSDVFSVIHDVLPPRTNIYIGQPQVNNLYVTSSSQFLLDAVDDLMEVGDGKGLGVKETLFRIQNTVFEKYIIPFTLSFEGKNIIEFYSLDLVGNIEKVNSISVFVDNSPPVTIDDYQYSDIWINQPAYITLTANDKVLPDSSRGVGVAKTEYIVAGSVNQSGIGNNISISNEGISYVSYYSTDLLGNVEETKTITIKLDFTPPIVDIIYPLEDAKLNTDVIVTYLMSDNYTVVEDLITIGDTFFTEEGYHTAVITAEDQAGNVGSDSVTFLIDKTPPVLSIAPLTTPTNQAVTLEISVSDNFSAVDDIIITGDNSPYTEEGEYIEIITATDQAGNQTSETVSFVIDLTPPVISINIGDPKYGSNPTYVTSQTEFTINVTDNLTGVAETAYKIDDGEYIIIQGLGVGGLGLVEGEHTITVRCKDGAGNIGSASID
ncbi:MAG: Ig-like domain-containing protein, partial [Candidatus Hydrogenedentota bacterium]